MRVEKISDTVHHLYLNDQEIVLIGTAHVSQNSVEEVKEIIEQENPDRICLELDDGRMKSKTENQSYGNMNLVKVFKEGKGFLLLANTALASFQKRIGTQTNAGNVGGEILIGAEIAKEKGIPFSLCDRNIQTTFRRAWNKSSFWNKIKLLSSLISAVFSKEEITAEELEELKQQDVLQSLMKELAKELPTVKEVLIDERDQYLARSIFETEGKKKVAIIGAGHTNGIIETIEKLEAKKETPSLSQLSEIPKPGPAGKIFSWLIPALIVGLLVYGGLTAGWDQGLRLFLVWVAVNVSSTFIATLASGAHPLNIIICAITAPFFALHPLLGVGMVGGILEATFRAPKVKDFENMADDALTLKGWYKNRILHCLLVFLLSSIGSALGTFIAFPVLLSKLG